MFRCNLSQCGQGQSPADKLLAGPFPEAWGARSPAKALVLSVPLCCLSGMAPLCLRQPCPRKEPLEEKHLGPLSEFYCSWILEMQDSRELGAHQSPPAVAANCTVLLQRSRGVGFSEIETVACQLRVHFLLMNYL